MFSLGIACVLSRGSICPGDLIASLQAIAEGICVVLFCAWIFMSMLCLWGAYSSEPFQAQGVAEKCIFIFFDLVYLYCYVARADLLIR